MIRVDPYTSDYAVSHRITNWNHIPHSFSPCELSHYIFFILNAPSTLFNLAFHNFPLNKKRLKIQKKRFRFFFKLFSSFLVWQFMYARNLLLTPPICVYLPSLVALFQQSLYLQYYLSTSDTDFRANKSSGNVNYHGKKNVKKSCKVVTKRVRVWDGEKSD